MPRWFRRREERPDVERSSPSIGSQVAPSHRPLEVSWAEARWVVGTLSANDSECVALIELAQAEWPSFVEALRIDRAAIGAATDDGPSPTVAAAETLCHQGFVRMLDWKFPASEVIGHYEACLRAHGLPELSETERADLGCLEPVDRRQEDLFFPDLAVPLDNHAGSVGRRLVGCDDGGDSYGFAIVTDFAHRQLVDHWYVWRFYDVTLGHPRPT